MRLLLAVQVLAFAAIVYGVCLVSVPAAFIVGGLLVVVVVERLT